jgi:hypothetical protein
MLDWVWPQQTKKSKLTIKNFLAKRIKLLMNQVSRWNLCRKRCTTGANTTPMPDRIIAAF